MTSLKNIKLEFNKDIDLYTSYTMTQDISVDKFIFLISPIIHKINNIVKVIYIKNDDQYYISLNIFTILGLKPSSVTSLLNRLIRTVVLYKFTIESRYRFLKYDDFIKICLFNDVLIGGRNYLFTNSTLNSVLIKNFISDVESRKFFNTLSNCSLDNNNNQVNINEIVNVKEFAIVSQNNPTPDNNSVNVIDIKHQYDYILIPYSLFFNEANCKYYIQKESFDGDYFNQFDVCQGFMVIYFIETNKYYISFNDIGHCSKFVSYLSTCPDISYYQFNNLKFHFNSLFIEYDDVLFYFRKLFNTLKLDSDIYYMYSFMLYLSTQGLYSRFEYDVANINNLSLDSNADVTRFSQRKTIVFNSTDYIEYRYQFSFSSNKECNIILSHDYIIDNGFNAIYSIKENTYYISFHIASTLSFDETYLDLYLEYHASMNLYMFVQTNYSPDLVFFKLDDLVTFITHNSPIRSNSIKSTSVFNLIKSDKFIDILNSHIKTHKSYTCFHSVISEVTNGINDLHTSMVSMYESQIKELQDKFDNVISINQNLTEFNNKLVNQVSDFEKTYTDLINNNDNDTDHKQHECDFSNYISLDTYNQLLHTHTKLQLIQANKSNDYELLNMQYIELKQLKDELITKIHTQKILHDTIETKYDNLLHKYNSLCIDYDTLSSNPLPSTALVDIPPHNMHHHTKHAMKQQGFIQAIKNYFNKPR